MPSVIIVGAGAAGIAATSKLLESNITDIVILEAEQKIGGRINSVKFGDGVVDLGAQACIVSENAFVYHIVKDSDSLEPIDTSKRIYRSSEGEQIDKDFTNKLKNIVKSIYSVIPEEIPDDVSLGQFLNDEYKKIISRQYKSEAQKLRFASDFLRTLERENLIYGGSFTWFDKLAKAEIKKTCIDAIFDWKGHGHMGFLDCLLQRQPNIRQKIKLNKYVNKIYWEDEVSVECSDGSVYKADHAILTVSLGVLKENINNLFVPKLPKEKFNAIEHIGISSKAIVFLSFSIRWWPTDVYSFGFVWPEQESMDNLYQPWISNFYGVYTVANNPHVLQAWFTGTHVPDIELLSDEELLNGIMFALNKFFGRKVSKPDAMLRTKWHSNRNFLGTNSFDTIESYKSLDREILSQPLTGGNEKPKVLFAGEATSLTRWGIVDGAVESGFREAERIIGLYK